MLIKRNRRKEKVFVRTLEKPLHHLSTKSSQWRVISPHFPQKAFLHSVSCPKFGGIRQRRPISEFISTDQLHALYFQLMLTTADMRVTQNFLWFQGFCFFLNRVASLLKTYENPGKRKWKKILENKEMFCLIPQNSFWSINWFSCVTVVCMKSSCGKYILYYSFITEC